MIIRFSCKYVYLLCSQGIYIYIYIYIFIKYHLSYYKIIEQLSYVMYEDICQGRKQFLTIHISMQSYQFKFPEMIWTGMGLNIIAVQLKIGIYTANPSPTRNIHVENSALLNDPNLYSHYKCEVNWLTAVTEWLLWGAKPDCIQHNSINFCYYNGLTYTTLTKQSIHRLSTKI